MEKIIGGIIENCQYIELDKKTQINLIRRLISTDTEVQIY
jgi:hypothetical protein